MHPDDMRTNDAGAACSIRIAAEADLPDIAAIYAHYVDHSVATFAMTHPTDDEWRSWFAEHTGAHPAIVATIGGRLVGWGTLSRWNSRCAYKTTVENSLYVHPEFHRRGIGRSLLSKLIEMANDAGHRVVVAQIADHQAASERLHESLGFRCVGCLEGVGCKFGRIIDVSIFQLDLPQSAIGE